MATARLKLKNCKLRVYANSLYSTDTWL